ncbi:hypothetical protein NVP1170O_051 [Vibrio phage 1.170.O._10N.261.52.C3]|nr:hypothetical protein NVP1170O_051 [Vibrio phage 1.170.O._10N.261.52.C3]
MTDIKLDLLTGDIDWEGGLKLTTTIEEKMQRIDMAINLNLGEFFAAVNYGLPWIRNTQENQDLNIRYFLGEKSSDQAVFIFNQLTKYLSKIPFIVDVESDYTFDQANRVFTYNYTVETEDGDVINFPPYTQTL